MRKIFVMGGGGFAMEPRNPLLDQYILSLSEKRKPKICFVATASGDSDRYIAKFHKAYGKLKCTPDHLSLFKPKTRDLNSFLQEQDILGARSGN